jgi:hypothetical protein
LKVNLRTGNSEAAGLAVQISAMGSIAQSETTKARNARQTGIDAASRHSRFFNARASGGSGRTVSGGIGFYSNSLPGGVFPQHLPGPNVFKTFSLDLPLDQHSTVADPAYLSAHSL